MINLAISGNVKEVEKQKFRSPVRNLFEPGVAAIAAVFLTRIDFAPVEFMSILWTGTRFAKVKFNHGR